MIHAKALPPQASTFVRIKGALLSNAMLGGHFAANLIGWLTVEKISSMVIPKYDLIPSLCAVSTAFIVTAFLFSVSSILWYERPFRKSMSAIFRGVTPETRLLEKAVQSHQPPLVNGRRIKLRYAHQGGMNPPRIIIHGNQVAKVPAVYKRYLTNFFRNELQSVGTPIMIEFKGSDSNPYDDGKKKKSTGKSTAKKRASGRLK